ncbi:MAG: tetratricopeptide repeat protein [Acidobacteriia bacterium]|nr:tetratricopeptide repeat protein [Terriglobia bacterium]
MSARTSSAITICRGENATAAANAAASQADAIVLRFAADTRGPVPWGAFRSYLAQGRAALGDSRVERAVSAQKVMLSLALRGLLPSLSEDERRLRQQSGGLALGDLPNSVMRDSRMYRAWWNTLGELFAGDKIVMVVPELDAIDLESLRGLRGVISSLRGRAEIHVIVGHDPAKAPADPVDAFFRTWRVAEIKRLEALPFARVELATGVASDADVPPTNFDPLDDRLEARAYAALAAHASNTPVLAAALRAAFDAFAFEPAFHLAEALLAIAGSDDSPSRDAIKLGALALYNLAPLAKEPWISEKLLDRFTRLLASETDPLLRAHWQYRLALTYARGRNSLDLARTAGDAAVETVEAVTNDARAPLFSAWAHNGRAYVRARSHDLEGAAADTEAGLKALEGGAGGVPETEVHVTRLFVANNRARVAQMAGDDEGLAKWRAIRTIHFDALPADDRPGPLWLPVPGGHRDLAAQRDHHSAVLADARERLDVDAEAIAAHGLGVTLYKLGDARGAHEAFATSLRIWSVIDGYAEDLLAEEFNTAVTAYRAGETTRAAEGFARVRKALQQDAAAQAETLGALAMIDARAGDRERAVTRAGQAVRAAEELGAPHVFIRTARTAAEAYLILGDRDRATEILERALAAIAVAEGDGTEFPAEDVLAVLVSRLDVCDGNDSDMLQRALRLAPQVLEDANAWWDLPRLAAHVRAHPEVERDEALAAGLATVAMVAGQRIAA